MPHTEDFSMCHYVGLSQIRSHTLSQVYIMVEHSVTGANYCLDTNYLIMLVVRRKTILTAAALANNSSRTHKSLNMKPSWLT